MQEFDIPKLITVGFVLAFAVIAVYAVYAFHHDATNTLASLPRKTVGNLEQVSISGDHGQVRTSMGAFGVVGNPSGAIGMPVYLSQDHKTLWITQVGDARLISYYTEQ